MNFIVGSVNMRGLFEGHNSNAGDLSVYNVKPLDNFRKKELLKLQRLNDYLDFTIEIPLCQTFAGHLWWEELLNITK